MDWRRQKTWRDVNMYNIGIRLCRGIWESGNRGIRLGQNSMAKEISYRK